MISVTTTVNVEKLRTFAPFANARLRDLVDDGRQAGELYMSSVVPHGRTNRLAASVVSSIYSVTDAHHVGNIGVDQRIAPYADMVDKGTGIHGPLRSPVTVNRGNFGRYRPRYNSRSGNTKHRGVMTFQKEGEPRRFMRTVKFRPVSKIERGKDFSGRTQNYMVAWTRIHVGVLARELSFYFSDTN